MKKKEFQKGDQVRELFSDFNGNRHLGRFGFVVDYTDQTTVAILWTHDSLGIPFTGSGRMHVSDIVGTGNKYNKRFNLNTDPQQ